MARGRAGGWGPFRLPGERRINERASAEADELMRRLDLLSAGGDGPADVERDAAAVGQQPAPSADVDEELASALQLRDVQGILGRGRGPWRSLLVRPVRPGLDVDAAVASLRIMGFEVHALASLSSFETEHDPRIRPYPPVEPGTAEPETDA